MNAVDREIKRCDRLVDGLVHLYRRRDVTDAQREVLLDAMNECSWDDAVHIAAPWEPRSSLCGNWGRNLVTLDEPRPDGLAGCWTCLMAAEWIDHDRTALDAPLTDADYKRAVNDMPEKVA